MQNRPLLYLFSLLLCLFWSCANVEDQPEYIVEQYIKLVNSGKIEEAKTYCTDARKAYLSALAGVMESAASRPDSSSLFIEEITCHEEGQFVICETIERDSFETIHINYQLVRENDRWLIDQPTIKGKIETHEEILSPNEDDQ